MKFQESTSMDFSKTCPETLKNETVTPSVWLSKRMLVTFLIFLGLINLSFIKGNISIAMVEMTSKKSIVRGNQTVLTAEFDWESTTKGLILNVYAYGGLCSFLLSSLPSKLGGSITYGTIMMLLSVLTMLIPFGLSLDFKCLLVLRFVIGFFENIAFSSTSDVFRHWIPLVERPRLMSFSHNGTYIGGAFLYSVCGFLAHKWGWAMVFYTTGLSTFVWALTWLILVPNDPSTDKWISKNELSYILAEIETTALPDTKISTPYKSILTSVPFWALATSRICLGWSVAVIYQCIPLYVKDATQKTTDLVGFLSSIPSIVCAILIPILGTVMNYWKNNSDIKYTKMHKIILGFNFCAGGCLVAAAAWMSNFIVSIACFAIVRTLLSCSALVLLMVMVHLAPNHSGAVTALTTFWYSLGNIFAQFFIGVITIHHSFEEWDEVFFSTAAVMVFSAIIFVIFCSSEPQPWSDISIRSDSEKKT